MSLIDALVSMHARNELTSNPEYKSLLEESRKQEETIKKLKQKYQEENNEAFSEGYKKGAASLADNKDEIIEKMDLIKKALKYIPVEDLREIVNYYENK